MNVVIYTEDHCPHCQRAKKPAVPQEGRFTEIDVGRATPPARGR